MTPTDITDVDSFAIGLPDVWVGLPLQADEFDRFERELKNRWRAAPDYDRSTERRFQFVGNACGNTARR